MWAHRYGRTADFIVVEGPKAGGHLGFSREQLADMENLDYEMQKSKILFHVRKIYEGNVSYQIPVIVAGVF